MIIGKARKPKTRLIALLQKITSILAPSLAMFSFCVRTDRK